MAELATVRVAYPHYGTVHAEFMESVLRTLGAGEARFTVSAQYGLSLNINRNYLVERFLCDGDESWLWMIDTDIAFPVGVLTHLLEDADPVEAPIVSALYLSVLGESTLPVWFLRGDCDGKFKFFPEMPTHRRTRLYGVGMGCCLMHRSALERIGQVFPDDPWRWFGADIVDTGNGRIRLGEDLSFCYRAALAEIPIWGSNICVQHIKRRVIGPGDFDSAGGAER